MEEITSVNLSLKEWADEDKPREKLLLKGKQALTDAELLAILLRSGSRNESVVELSKKLLLKVGNDLNELGKLSVKDILSFGFKGIGETKAVTLVASLELGRRRQSAEIKERTKISSSKDTFELMSPCLSDLIHEEFWIILLNRANKVMSKEQLSTGGITGTVVDARRVFNLAIQSNAVSIILCHNHPSGNTSPSVQDISLTKKLKEAGTLLEIAVLDHLIIADKRYYSFADEGML